MTHALIKNIPLQIEKLSFGYEQELVLNQLNIQLHEGQKVGLIGSNGAGKTTLFMLVCGILPPKSGNIYIFDQKVELGNFYPEIGVVFQNPNDQLFCPTVKDDICFGLENLGLEKPEIETRLQEVTQLTNISHLLDCVPYQLSGGEKCMVAIASVLAMRPRLVLYDEPSANLDLKSRRRLINFLKKSQQTIWISSHDLELLLEVCDRILLLNQGQVIADGSPQAILSDRDLMETNQLEVPHSLQ
ncbi:MAG: energy-coupling factor ABC transporter ATP-binding protein [Microcystaceae cyanobacterium]